MHADPFDRYRPADSPIHRLDPRAKVTVVLLAVLSNVLLPDGAWAAYGFALAAVVVVTVLADLAPLYAVKRSVVALPFLLAAVAIAFAVPGEPLATWHVGPWTLQVTDSGLVRLFSIVGRSLLSVMAVVLLTATTPFPDIAHALRHLRVPAPLVATVAFAYRYLFVLTDEALRMLRARQARSARLPGRRAGGTVLWRGRVAGHMAGQLFLRSLERADRVHQAMVARGYRGQILTMRPHVLVPADWLAVAAAALFLAGLQAFARLGGP